MFHYCALEGNVSVLREILKNLHSGQIQLAVNKQSVNGWSPLIVAASKGHTEVAMVRMMLFITNTNGCSLSTQFC